MERFQIRNGLTRALIHTPEAPSRLTDALWSAPDSLIADGDRLIQKKCVRTTVRFAVEEESYVVKRHVERSWRHWVKQCFSRSRAEKCWTDTWYLVNHGYPTPPPVAIREERLGFLRGRSFYVYHYVEGTTLKAAATGLKNQRLLRNYVNQLVEIWRMHKLLRVNLSDGHPANFVLDSTGKMWVIDLDKLRYLAPHGEDDCTLIDTFESTMRGVFGDESVLRYGSRKIQAALAETKAHAA